MPKRPVTINRNQPRSRSTEISLGHDTPESLVTIPKSAVTIGRNTHPLALVNQDQTVPEEYKTRDLLIKYRAKHPEIKIPLGLFDPTRVDVQLPDAYLEALLLFIAARVHSPIGMQGEGQVGNNWFSRYEAECNRLEMANLDLDRGMLNTRLERGGWV